MPMLKGANIILLQKLFSGPYFCRTQEFSYFSPAQKVI